MTPTIYIKVPMHIRQWAYHSYGQPVVFPPTGNECAVIRRFISKPPTAKLSSVEQEQQEQADGELAARLHQSVAHIKADDEYDKRLWLQHPEEYLAIEIPESKAKPRREFCYMGPRGRSAVREVVVDLFKLNLWSELKDIPDRTCRLSTLISAWCEMHGICIDSEDSVRQVFYRMRADHREKGVNLNTSTRIKKD